jgi:hypothetical protein
MQRGVSLRALQNGVGLLLAFEDFANASLGVGGRPDDVASHPPLEVDQAHPLRSLGELVDLELAAIASAPEHTGATAQVPRRLSKRQVAGRVLVRGAGCHAATFTNLAQEVNSVTELSPQLGARPWFFVCVIRYVYATSECLEAA